MNTYYNEEAKNANNIIPKNELEQLISGETKIFIDTCSMLEDSFPLFAQHVFPLLEKHNNIIIVPLAVVRELIHHLDNSAKPELKGPSIRALGILDQYKGKYFRIFGNEADPFPDNLFQTLCVRFRPKYRMLFITQDNALAADLLNCNGSSSVRGNTAAVRKITPQGYLAKMRVVCRDGKWSAPDRMAGAVGNAAARKTQPFRICMHPTDMPDEVIPLTEVPGKSDAVYAMNPVTEQFAGLTLGDRIATGGEGSVYETNTGFVAKIYKEDKVTTRRRQKVLLMAKKELEYEGISFPVMPLFNRHSEFIGYLMEKAVGEELRTSVFCPIPKFKEKHPDWKKEDLVQLCITILGKMNYLHSKNIIMGDINPGNILVKSPTEVFFVDTDSYQIEDFPCPVGQCNYTAPEIQGKEYNSFLRTMGNENFAIATLLFQILLPGKLPYSHSGGGKQNENILQMNFPYRLGENGDRNEPVGQWKFMWSHLTYAVKEAFYNTFHKDGTYTAEDQRLSAAEWRKILIRYLDLLRNGTLAGNDPMSESIFPTRWKAGTGASWAVCKHCGERFPYYQSRSGRNSNPPTYCFVCQRKISEWIVCEDCGEEFPVYVPNYDYYKEKGYVLPKRCPSCREKRKAESERRRETAQMKRYGGLDFKKNILEGKREPSPSPARPVRPASLPAIPQRPVRPAPVTAVPERPVRPAPAPVAAPKSTTVPGPQPVPVPRPQPVPNPLPDPSSGTGKRSALERFHKWLVGA